MDTTLLLYIGIMAAGILIGSRTMSPEKEYKWLGRLQFLALMVLITALGIRIGADDKVVSSLKEIGLSAFVITIFTLAGSLLCLWLVRKWMGLDREGVKKDD